MMVHGSLERSHGLHPPPIFPHRKTLSEILGFGFGIPFFLHGPQDVKSTELKALQSLLSSGDATGGTFQWLMGDFGGEKSYTLEDERLEPTAITHLERKMIFQTSMIMFHVNLQGCRNYSIY